MGRVSMAIYQGTVKAGVIVLNDDIALAEGSSVEVRVSDSHPEAVLTRLAASLAEMGVRVETKPVMLSAAGAAHSSVANLESQG